MERTKGANDRLMETKKPDGVDLKDAAASKDSRQNIDKMDGNKENNNRETTQESSDLHDDQLKCNLIFDQGIEDNISEYLDEVGLKNYFPRKLTLRKATEVRLFPKDRSAIEKKDLPFLFFSKLTSLDNRITWKESLNIDGSVRDFIYAMLQCSDDHLRQHLMEKLASCQLALPILIPGVRNDVKPELLIWAISRVVKTWKESETSISTEKRMVSEPVFTAAFIRLGDIPISKSSALNNVIGRAQGNETSRYFLSFEDENELVYNCCGTVEALWYLPMYGRKEELLEKVTLMLNLRGDSEGFSTQTEFMCRVANAIFLFVDNDKLECYKKAIDDIKKRIEKVFVIRLVAKKERKGNAQRVKIRPKKKVNTKDEQPQISDSVDFELDRSEIELSKIICKKIVQYCNDTSEKDYNSIDNWRQFCLNEVGIDQDNPAYETAIDMIKCLFPEPESIEKVTNSFFQLQEDWVEWVKADKKPIAIGNQDVAFQFAAKESIKKDLINKQAEKGLSEKMQVLLEILQIVLIDDKEDTLHYFMSLFQTHIELMAAAEIPPLATRIDELNTSLQEQKQAMKTISSSYKLQNELKDEITKLEGELLEVSKTLSERNITCEHFIRELGHLYVARLNRKSCAQERNLLSHVAVKLLRKGYPLEILDGENAYMPIQWISGVLTRVKDELNNPRIFVLSIIGIQSSGKSTLLNSMFGVKFPVRAGRCTRGLYLQLIEVNEAFSKQLGFEYLLIIDTEGLHAPDRTVLNDHTFDNSIATLAMCIGNFTLLNIGQETIGPDMIGILQIVVHAMIRMKKVNLVSNCRIIQQRVSDITAAANNKSSMAKIKDVLNKVTRTAAIEERVDHIRDFSDVFPMVEGDDLQFFPCLWTGLMSPPNFGYSDKVHALKSSILLQDNISSTPPQFSMEKFISRLKDVWEAVKSEDFVFNFQNSFDALSNNRFRLHHNILIGKMKTALTGWELEQTDNLSSATKDEFFRKVEFEINERCEGVNDRIKEYVKAHSNEEEVKRRQQSILNETFDIGRDIQSAIVKHTNILLKNKEDIQHLPYFIKQAKQELKQAAKNTALDLLKTNPNTNWDDNRPRLDNEFEMLWRRKTKELEENLGKTKISDKKIDEACDKSLSRLLLLTEYSKTYKSKVTALWTKVTNLVSSGCRDDITAAFELDRILSVFQCELRNQKHIKPFHHNHVDTVLTEMYTTLKRHNVNGEFLVDSLMKASRVLAEAYKKYQAEYEKAHSVKDMFEDEKKILNKNFLAFFIETIRIEATVDQIYSELMTATQDKVVNKVHITLLEKMRADNCYNSKDRLTGKILEELFYKKKAYLYVEYIQRNQKFLYNWLRETVIETMKLKDGWVITLIKKELDNALRGISMALLETEAYFTENKAGTTYHDWLRQFISRSSIKPHIILDSADDIFTLSDVKGFTESLNKVVSENLSRDIQVALHLWNSKVVDETVTSVLCSKMKKDVAQEILDHLGVCNAVCPFCQVTCHLQISGKHTHVATFHYPQGVSGFRWIDSKHLISSPCTLLVSTDCEYIFQTDPKLIFKKYKDYETDYKSWFIQRIKDDKPIHYWIWVLKTFNAEFARIYNNSKPAKIPEEWDNVTPDMAIKNLRQQYKHHEIQ